MAMKSDRVKPSRVLVADDDEAICAIVAAFLGEADIEVSCVSDGAEALERLREGETLDLLVLDLCMPRLDGWRVLDEMRSDAGLSHPRVIVVTSFGSVEDLPAGIPVLHKPLDPTLLTTIVQSLLVGGPSSHAARPEAVEREGGVGDRGAQIIEVDRFV